MPEHMAMHISNLGNIARRHLFSRSCSLLLSFDTERYLGRRKRQTWQPNRSVMPEKLFHPVLLAPGGD